MSHETISVRREGHVLHVALNRPEQLNAFDRTMMDELTDLWMGQARASEVRVVVLTGSGRAFCAGADMGDLSGERSPRGAGVDDELSFLPGPHLDVPVVVAVNGVCAGGGLHFVADADIVIASERATFVDPHVSVGQVSALEPVSLAFRVPVPALMRMVLLGRHERLDAEAAQSMGLVSEVVDADRLADRAAEIAGLIALSSPAAIAGSRRALRSLERDVLHDAMEQGWDLVQQHWAHPDSHEGPVAFAEGREPHWSVEPKKV